jgi:hypothetical protein
MENSEVRLSPSEKRTLQHLVEGERHPSELDWVALQRLKRLGLAEVPGTGIASTVRAHPMSMVPSFQWSLGHQKLSRSKNCNSYFI